MECSKFNKYFNGYEAVAGSFAICAQIKINLQ